jgi:hypothetical protein
MHKNVNSMCGRSTLPMVNRPPMGTRYVNFMSFSGVNSSRRPRPAFEVDNLALDGSKYDRGPCVPENPHLGDDDVWFFWIQ